MPPCIHPLSWERGSVFILLIYVDNVGFGSGTHQVGLVALILSFEPKDKQETDHAMSYPLGAQTNNPLGSRFNSIRIGMFDALLKVCCQLKSEVFPLKLDFISGLSWLLSSSISRKVKKDYPLIILSDLLERCGTHSWPRKNLFSRSWEGIIYGTRVIWQWSCQVGGGGNGEKFFHTSMRMISGKFLGDRIRLPKCL